MPSARSSPPGRAHAIAIATRHPDLCRRSRLALHALRRMEARIAPVFFLRCPIRRHPTGPADLPETAELRCHHGAGRNGELGLPFELIADIEEYRVGQRLA